MREKVLFLWNQGFSRDEIAKAVGIGTDTVSEIMEVYRQNDSDIDLQREYVLNVRKQGYNIDQLGPAIRLSKRFEKLNLNQSYRNLLGQDRRALLQTRHRSRRVH